MQSDYISLLQAKENKKVKVRKLTAVPVDIVEEESTQKKYVYEQKYVCDVCQKKFSVKREHAKHVKSHETKEKKLQYTPKCAACNLEFANLAQFRDHQKEFHPVVISASGQAEMSTFVSSNKELQKYRFECEFCKRLFPRKHVLLKHQAKHKEENKVKVQIKCEECDKTFKIPSELRDHNLVHHSAEPPQYHCDKCNKDFILKDYLRNHIKYNHILTPSIVCGVDGCTKIFKTKQKLKKHLLTYQHNASVDKAYKCDQCDFATPLASSLKRHMLKHDTNKPFVCDKCPDDNIYRGKTAEALRDHQTRMHTDQKKYVCDVCNKRFNDRSACARHKEIHAKKVIKCQYDFCPFKTTAKCNLQAHIRVNHSHKNIKLKCPECQKEYSNTRSLKYHLFSHTPEGIPKPILCPWPDCQQRFTYKGQLKNHYRIHTGEKPFLCKYDGCNSAFADSSTLRKHIAMHNNDKRFVCHHTECGMAFVQSHTLKNHLIAKHTPEGIQRQKRSEHALAKALTKYGIDYNREHTIDFNCAQTGTTRAYIDFMHIQNGVVHFIENDEHQHNDRNISCECTRMINVYSSIMLEGNNLPVMFWRFNPHYYKKNKVKQTHTFEERVKTLVQKIKEFSSLDKALILPLTVHYIGYTTINDVLVVSEDPEFVDALKPCVKVHHIM